MENENIETTVTEAESTNANIKTRSVRADEAVLNRFAQLSKDYFGSQNECLAQLVATWEMHNSASELPEMKADINDVEAHLQSVQSAFVHILELNANTESRIALEYNARLESKDKIITDYQQKIQDAKESLNALKVAAEDTALELGTVKDKLESATQENSRLTAVIADKSELIADKQAIIDELTSTIAEIKSDVSTIAEIKSENEIAMQKIDKLTRELAEEKATADWTKKTAELEIKEAKANAELAVKTAELNAKTAIAEAKEKSQERIDELSEIIEKLRNDIYTLRATQSIQ